MAPVPAPGPWLALLTAALLCCSARGDGDPPDPVYLPAELELLGVPEYYRLQRADRDIPTNTSMDTRTETFLVLRHSPGTQPLLQATYPPFSTRQEVPMEKEHREAWAVRAVSIESSVSPAEPFARVLFHLYGPDWMAGKRDHPKEWEQPGERDHHGEQDHPGKWDHHQERDHPGEWGHPKEQNHPRNWDHPKEWEQPKERDHPKEQDHPGEWDHPKEQNHARNWDHPKQREHPGEWDHPGKRDHPMEWDQPMERDHPKDQDLPCVTLHAHHRGRVARGSCHLQAPLGACVVELEIPPRWFSPEPPEPAELHYSVTGSRECRGRAGDAPRYLGSLELRAAEPVRWQEVRLDAKVLLRVPDASLRPGQRFTATIALRHNFTADHLVLRIKAKKGLQVMGARAGVPGAWTAQVERSRGPKHSTVVVTCRRSGDADGGSRVADSEEFLHLDVAVENGTGGLAPARPLTWQVEYPGQDPEAQKDKLVWEIQVSERDVRALVPLVQDLEILNTAPLTGVPRFVPVRLVAVEAGGGITELPEPPGCESADKQVLQVSEGCSAVQVLGRESRGARGARVDFWCRRLHASLLFTVWAPLLPLRIQLGDTALEQVRGWRLPADTRSSPPEAGAGARRWRGCRPQFQRTALRVLAHFAARPLAGGRPLAYLPGPAWLLDVTPLVAARTRVQDPRVAALEPGPVLVGLEPGVTSVEVRSPLSDSILGEQTLVVSEEKVTVTELRAQLVSGLSLTARAEPGHRGLVTASAVGTGTLRVPKQEATLSVWLSFSDHTLAPLELYGWQDTALTLTSLDPAVATVGGSPGVPTAHPWVVAEGPGRGALLQLSLHPPDACRRGRPRAAALATGTAWLEVLGGPRASTPGSPPGPGSPFHRAEGAMSGEAVTAASEARRRDPAGMGPANTKLQGLGSSSEEEEDGYGQNGAGEEEEEEEEEEIVKAPERVTDLEIGMYVLLGVFCLAIFIFLINCIFFVLRYQQKELPEPAAPSAPQPHNWVWLGTDQQELSRQLDRRQPEPPAPDGGTDGRCCCGSEAGGDPSAPAPAAPQPHREGGAPQPHREGGAPRGGRRKRVEFVTFSPAWAPEEPPEPVPNVQSILVASEDDIRWVCEDMGLRDPEELRSYMERIRGSS